jgi:hypothetical protein
MSIVKLNNQAVKNATSFGSISSLGSMTFIKKLTASSSATLSFVDGSDGVVLDDTYKEYVFTFNNIHPATNNVNLQFNMSSDGGSNYNITKTTTQFRASHGEDDGGAVLEYRSGEDLAQSTSFQSLIDSTGNDNDQSTSGTLRIFNPSSTTFVKHFISNMNGYRQNDQTTNVYVAGYGNTTSAVDGVQFKMSSGNIDAGDICLYGIA